MNLLHFEILIFIHFSLLATGIALDGNPYWISLEIGALSWKPNCLVKFLCNGKFSITFSVVFQWRIRSTTFNNVGKAKIEQGLQFLGN